MKGHVGHDGFVEHMGPMRHIGREKNGGGEDDGGGDGWHYDDDEILKTFIERMFQMQEMKET